MTAYVVLFRESPIRNAEEMQTYQSMPRPADTKGLKPLVVYGAQEPIEGTPPDGVVILEFPSVEAAREWYHSPEYQAASKHRRNAADYRGVIVEGFTMPG